MQYIFKNIKSHIVKLPDKNGKMVHFSSNEKKTLDSFFKKYVPKYLSVLKEVKEQHIDVRHQAVRIIKPFKENDERNIAISRKAANSTILIGNGRRKITNSSLVGRVGRLGRRNATEFSQARIKENSIPISNDIGVGILSYNRLKSLISLIESIRKHTDLNKTTVFVSDESTDGKTWEWLSKQKDIVAFHNERGGIAINSNRLLRCLSRFTNKILLNDDVEILKNGWDSFYFDAMNKTGMKHFCFRQEGVYGAKRPRPNGNGIIQVDDKPHGAVLAIHDDAFRKVGYFDENFGTYGFEHVDYSDRIALNCHNSVGYLDFRDSDKFFKIYNDPTSDPHKHENYIKAKTYYSSLSKNRCFIPTSKKSKVDGVTYIIPFRDIGREECVRTVVNNVKAQRYPEIQIILAEQDIKSRIDQNKFKCIDHMLITSLTKDMHFCKSMAFNRSVSKSLFDNLIMHDADMLVRSDYTNKIVGLLSVNESVHIGNTVCYMEKESTDEIIRRQEIDSNAISSDRVVSYYEGGSFGITKSAYIKIGGFCEDFIGYGCEDTEFYRRMTKMTKSFTTRSIDLFHLWHGRTNGWMERHDINKKVQERMFRENISSLCDRLNKYYITKYGK